MSQWNEGLAGQCQDVQVLFVTGGCFSPIVHAVASPWLAEHKELYPLPLLKWSPGKGAGPALSVGSAKWHCPEKWSKEGISVWRGRGCNAELGMCLCILPTCTSIVPAPWTCCPSATAAAFPSVTNKCLSSAQSREGRRALMFIFV